MRDRLGLARSLGPGLHTQKVLTNDCGSLDRINFGVRRVPASENLSISSEPRRTTFLVF